MSRNIHAPLHHETSCHPPVTQSEQGQNNEECKISKYEGPGAAIGDVAGPEKGPEEDAEGD